MKIESFEEALRIIALTGLPLKAMLTEKKMLKMLKMTEKQYNRIFPDCKKEGAE